MSTLGRLLEDLAFQSGMGRSVAGALRREADATVRELDDLRRAAKQTNTGDFDAAFVRATDGYFSILPHEGASIARDSELSINDATWTKITFEDEADLSDDYKLWTYNKGMRVESSAIKTEHSTPIGSAFMAYGVIHFGANSTGERELRVKTTDGGWLNVAAISAIASGTTNVAYCIPIETDSANPSFELYAYQSSGGALNINAGVFGVTRIK